ncbi:MAG: PTS sugar transporter subunit IIC [Clostridia bacterium]|nr:PTS sugar transporter subunit IIC [Clostridia bacterium]MBQ8352245.1 PTS sugar transporter subunit IIC [Clostridia bacterium]
MEEVKQEKKESSFLKYLKALPKRFFITAFSGMAQGLFVTLIAGTILAQIAGWIGVDRMVDGQFVAGNYVGNTLLYIANIAKSLMGAGIGVGIAHALGKHKLLTFSAAVAGMIGAFADKLMVGQAGLTVLTLGAPGNPIGAYVVTMLCVEIASLYAGKTKLDIILIPLGVMLLSFSGVFVAYPFIWLVNQLGALVAIATNATPFVMGIVIAVVMGVLLTMPTSSAAIWVAVSSPVLAAGSGVEYEAMLLAGGAATVGCACHMVGFAVASFRENGVSGLISQGIGTSMLQIPNIMKKPQIMLPMVVSSAICGPLSTCVFALKCGASGGGMGTSGLVGVFDLFKYTSGALGIVGIILLMIVLPAILNLLFSEIMRKKGWIKQGDMKLDD